jgi:hypothetical protein
MSTDERAMTPVRRRSRPALSLPPDPSDEALARDWTLSAADKSELTFPHCIHGQVACDF